MQKLSLNNDKRYKNKQLSDASDHKVDLSYYFTIIGILKRYFSLIYNLKKQTLSAKTNLLYFSNYKVKLQ